MSLEKVIKPQSKRAREEETERNYKNSQETMSKKAIRPYLSVVTLNVNGLNPPVKRHRMADWITKTGPIYMLPTMDSFYMSIHTA